MAGKDFVNGEFCIARVNCQSLLQCRKKRENVGSGQLEARLLSAEDVGCLASLGPGRVVVVVIRGLASRVSGAAMLASW